MNVLIKKTTFTLSIPMKPFYVPLTFVILLCFASWNLLAQTEEEHPCARQKQYSATLTPVANRHQIASMQDYDVHYYKLDLAIERNSIYLSGNTTIAATVLNGPLTAFAFELHPNFTIDSLKVNQQTTGTARNGAVVTATLGFPGIAQGGQVSVQVFYKGTAPSGASAAIGNGFSTGTSGSWGNQATWSLSQPYAAYEWFPVKQQLADKADSVEVWITTDSTNRAGSNGLLQQVTPMPGGKKRWEWKSRYAIAYYLISVSVARYVEYVQYAKPTGYPDSIFIQNFIYDNPATLPNFLTEINKTASMLQVFSSLYGLYPFHEEKYGHCMAPFSGGMEHQTMTTQGLFNQDLTAHELGHQWFGDHVTCGSWKDIWVNEGFATYSEYLYRQSLSAASALTWMNSKHSSILSQTGGSVYVPDTTDVPRIFSSRLTYNKGAAILHILRYEINNDSLFFAALRTYQQLYSFGVATGVDFKSVVESTTGQSFTDFFNQWYFGQGYPTFAVQWNQVGTQFYLSATQSTSFPSVTPLFKTSVDYRVVRTGLPDTILRVWHDQPSKAYTFTLGGVITSISVDPNQNLLNGTGSVTKNTNLVLATEDAEVEEMPSLEAWPIPVKYTLTVRLQSPESDKAQQAMLLDARGVVVQKIKLAPGVQTIQLRELPYGVYHLVLEERPLVRTTLVVE